MRISIYALVIGLIPTPLFSQSGYVTRLDTHRPNDTFVNAYAPASPGGVQQMPAANSTPPAPVQPNAVLQQGTPVHFVTQKELNSKHDRVSDRFELRVSEDVIINGVTVIPAGARGVGEITHIDKKGMFGKSGKIAARVLYVRVGQQNISMSGSANEAGSGGTAGVVAAAVLFWPVAPFITGRSAALPPGSRMTGWVENDIPLVLRAPPPPTALVVN